MTKNSKSFHLTIDVISIVLLIILDRITKNLAVAHLKDKPAYPIINRVFVLSYLENRGAAFGIFQNRQIFFLIVSVIFVVAIGYFLFRLPLEKKYNVAEAVLIFLAAGAFGNMIDRAVQNYVVDFFYFELIDFPVFNVADIYVTLSCIALFILIVFVYKEEDLAFMSLKKKHKDEQI